MTRFKYQRRDNIKDKYIELGKLLRVARESQGLTMRDVAGKSFWPHSVVGKIETAERRIDVVELIQYCHLLGIDPKIIFAEIVDFFMTESVPKDPTNNIPTT